MGLASGYSVSVNCDHIHDDGSICNRGTEFGGSELKSVVWKHAVNSKWLINKKEGTAYCPHHKHFYGSGKRSK